MANEIVKASLSNRLLPVTMTKEHFYEFYSLQVLPSQTWCPFSHVSHEPARSTSTLRWSSCTIVLIKGQVLRFYKAVVACWFIFYVISSYFIDSLSILPLFFFANTWDGWRTRKENWGQERCLTLVELIPKVCTEGITAPSKSRGDAALYTCSNWDFLFYNSRQYFDYKSIMFDCAWYIYSLAAMAPINKEERRACSGWKTWPLGRLPYNRGSAPGSYAMHAACSNISVAII